MFRYHTQAKHKQRAKTMITINKVQNVAGWRPAIMFSGAARRKSGMVSVIDGDLDSVSDIDGDRDSEGLFVSRPPLQLG